MRPPASLRLYALAAAAAAPAANLYLRGRMRRGKEDPDRLGERQGRAGLDRPPGPLAWLHGASVGEGLSLLSLIDRIGVLRPDASVLVTTGTRASAEVLAGRLPQGVIHQFAPIDTPAAVARFIGHWRPNLGVFVESELWPNLIGAARGAGVPLALVSARMSAASFRTWRMAPGAAGATLGAFDLILARDDAAGQRFQALGGKIDGVWDAKLGATPLPADEKGLDLLRRVLGDRPVILAASTHPGEERIIADAFAAIVRERPDALLIIAPRHADRGEEVMRIARGADLRASRRSAGDGPDGVQVWVADTLGEMGAWYRLAMLAVVGGSLVDGVGGHNPLEAARLHCPFVAGAHVEAWPIYADLVAAGGTSLVHGVDDLRQWMRQALGRDAAIEIMAANAFKDVARRDKAGEAVAVRLMAMLAA